MVLEAARKAQGFFVLNAAPAMDLPAQLLERCDLVIVNESEYALIPPLAKAKLVAVHTAGTARRCSSTAGRWPRPPPLL